MAERTNRLGRMRTVDQSVLDEFARRWGLPFEATRGGAETMYPEYTDKVKRMPKPPALR